MLCALRQDKGMFLPSASKASIQRLEVGHMVISQAVVFDLCLADARGVIHYSPPNYSVGRQIYPSSKINLKGKKRI